MTPSYAVDDSLKIVLVYKSAVVKTPQHNITIDSKSYPLIDSIIEVRNGLKYTVYHSPLPLLQIYAPTGIGYNRKRNAQFSYVDSTQQFISDIGIEIRGSSSRFFPKKTYDLNFYKDTTGTNNRDVQFANMRKDDDWILDGLYNEPLRLRSRLSLELWKEIHQPYYRKKEPKSKSGVSTMFCEVFLNGHYKGIYLLSEQIDRKLLKIKKEKNREVRGELFKGAAYAGAVTFDSLPPVKNYLNLWGGYEIKYPYPNDFPWDNLYNFTKLVVEGKKEVFKNTISKHFNLDNAIDYFIFINAVRAPDNRGKNVYTARLDNNEPYFYVPWDLDGTFGTIFSGKRIPTTDDFLTNGLLRRLLSENPEDFVLRFKTRWKELRKTILSFESLSQHQRTEFEKLEQSGAYEREKLIWSNFQSDDKELQYMIDWTQKRLVFLDGYIEKL